MTQATAPMSPAIKFITGLVVAMIVALLVAGLKVCGLLLGGAILGDRRLVSAIFLPPLLMNSPAIS